MFLPARRLELPHVAVAAPSLSQRVDPHQMMMNASAMPVTEFVDYSFVFVH